MGYPYYISKPTFKNLKSGESLEQEIFNPSLANQDYIVLKHRRKNISRFINRIESDNLRILDVGGRLQPYKPMLINKINSYIAIDPIFEGKIDIIGIGETLPFRDKTFDLVISTQVLSYATSPQLFIDEIYRVLKSSGYLIVSAPAFFPKHHDEHWRILPEGWKILLHNFGILEIQPEGYSIAGICRTINILLKNYFKNRLVQRLMELISIPLINKMGFYFDRFYKNNSFTANYCILATKKESDNLIKINSFEYKKSKIDYSTPQSN